MAQEEGPLMMSGPAVYVLLWRREARLLHAMPPEARLLHAMPPEARVLLAMP
jgi:hypothetical protein